MFPASRRLSRRGKNERCLVVRDLCQQGERYGNDSKKNISKGAKCRKFL